MIGLIFYENDFVLLFNLLDAILSNFSNRTNKLRYILKFSGLGLTTAFIAL